MTLSHIDQFGSISTLTLRVCRRNEACPIHVRQISPPEIFGKSGMRFLPSRLVKTDGMSTSVRKLRLCQSAPGFSPTFLTVVPAPLPEDWITFRRLFLEKGI